MSLERVTVKGTLTKHIFESFEDKRDNAYKILPSSYMLASEGRKILLVLGKMTEDDIKNHNLSSHHGEVITNMIKYSLNHCDTPVKEIRTLNFSFMPSFSKGRQDDFDKEQARFIKRLTLYIKHYKPDTVVVSDIGAFLQCAKTFVKHKVDFKYLNRVLEAATPDHEFTLMGTIATADLATQDPKFMKIYPNLIGYWCRGFAQGLNGENRYTVNVDNRKVVLINTVAKFDAFLEKLKKAAIVSIDTESESLNRYKNKLFTIQFSFDGIKAYLIPLFHFETPFNGKELAYVCTKLRDYFETNKAKYHIYQNAKFDTMLIRLMDNSLGIRFYKAPIYDTMAGEFALDENVKNLKSLLSPYDTAKRKIGAYSLAYMTTQYGCFIYDQIEFKKENRVNMADTKLIDFIDYACIDALVIFQICMFQQQEAKRLNDDKFLTFLLNQFGNNIKMFAVFETNGVLIDRSYLYTIKAKSGPVTQILKEEEAKFKELKSIQTVNTELIEQAQLPTSKSLFGQDIWLFNVNKPEHQSRLFYGNLRLASVSLKKDGTGKLGKPFFEKHRDVNEVKVFSRYSKIKTIKSTFVDGVFTTLTRSDDSRFDSRLRPNFGFMDVVTGRPSTSDPNMLNMPQRGEFAKLIKRYFIASVYKALIEMDFNAHEVRMWGNVARDKKLKAAFDVGYTLRLQYRLATSLKKMEKIAIKLKKVGDLHIQNVKFFFNKLVDKDNPLRDAIKAVVFGVIYGKGAKSLGADLLTKGFIPEDKQHNPEAYAQMLIDKLFETFQQGGGYITRTIKRARSTLKIISPIGRVRHLWGYLHNRQGVQNAMNRRGPNSDIQGLASDIGLYAAHLTEKMVWNFFTKHGIDTGYKAVNFIYDSVKSEAYIPFVPVIMYLQEHACTTLIHRNYKKLYGFDMSIALEIEFKAGFVQSDMHGWDYRYEALEKGIESKIAFHKDYYRLSDAQVDLMMANFRHNLAIIKTWREKELKIAVKTTKPQTTMLINEANARSIGLKYMPKALKEKIAA